MTDRLHFTGNEEADRLIAQDPFALLIGFALDQRVPVPKAFMGPYVLRERLGSLEPAAVAAADLEPIFRQIPAIHRFPAMMAKQVHALAVHIVERYDGDAARVWTDAKTSDELRANIAALPGFGTMKVKALGSVLAKRFGVALAEPLIPWHPTLGDVDSAAGAGRLPGVQEDQQGAGRSRATAKAARRGRRSSARPATAATSRSAMPEAAKTPRAPSRRRERAAEQRGAGEAPGLDRARQRVRARQHLARDEVLEQPAVVGHRERVAEAGDEERSERPARAKERARSRAGRPRPGRGRRRSRA